MAPTDLIRAAQSGDQEAFAELVRPLERPLKSYLYRLSASPDDVGDLYQDTLLKAFEHLSTFRAESSFKTWLFAIASNTATDYLRGKKRWAAEAQDRRRASALSDAVFRPTVQELVTSTPQAQYEIREHIDFCFTCIAKTLPQDQQMALLLRDVYDFSNEEGARVLGKSVPVFKHLVHEARQTMIRLFEGRCALINKQGVCYQCSELSDRLRGTEETQRQMDSLKLKPRDSAEARAKTFDLRLRLIKVIDPLNANGTNFHHFLTRYLRTANEYD